MTDSKDSLHQAQALLALGLTREKADFRVPSDEELAQLLDPEQSPMEATRKAQVMDAIANDPATFSRWMALVDTAETLELGPFSLAAHATAQRADQAPSLISRLRRALSDNLRAVLATGGAAAMAMGLALVFLLPVGMDSRVTRLYDDFGTQWSTRPEQLDVIRGGQRAAETLSAVDQRLQQGVVAGQARLGEDFAIRNLNTTSATDTSALPDSVSESLFMLGQVAAISHFKCALGADERYFDESWALILALSPALMTQDDATTQTLAKILAREGKAETQVCRVSKAVIARVTK